MEQARLEAVLVDKVSGGLQKIDSRLGKMNNSLFSVKKTAGLVTSALGAIGAVKLIKGFVDAGKSVESLQIRFKALFGSAEEGAKAFDTLTEFAAKVPFSLQEISEASGNLAVISKDSQALSDNLELTGNIAAQFGLDFRTAGEQVQRALSGGIAAADIFREKGVTAFAGFQQGVRYTAEETARILNKVYGPGGSASGVMDEFAKTLTGTVSMLQDKFFKFQKAVANEFFDELKSELGDLNKFFDENADVLDEYAKLVGQTLAKAIVKLGEGVRYVYENQELFITGVKVLLGLQLAKYIRSVATAFGILNMTMRANPLGLVITAIQLVIVAFIAFENQIKKILNLIPGVNFELNEQAVELKNVSNQYEGALDSIKRMEQEQKNLKTTTQELTDTTEELTEAERKRQEEIEKNRQKALDTLQSQADALLDGLRTEKEAINDRYQEERFTLTKAKQQMLITEQEYREAVKRLDEKYYGDLDRLRKEDLEKGKIASLKAKGFDEQMIQKRLEFDKMSSQQRTAFGLEQANTLFTGLGQVNKKFFAAQKAIAIAQAVMNTYQGATKALATYPPPFNFLAAAAVVASGMGQVAAIRAQTYQRGGLMDANQPAIVGEAGPELIVPKQGAAVIPNEITRMLGQGNNKEVTVNFNINTVDASDFDDLLLSRRGLISSIINDGLQRQGKAALI